MAIHVMDYLISKQKELEPDQMFMTDTWTHFSVSASSSQNEKAHQALTTLQEIQQDEYF